MSTEAMTRRVNWHQAVAEVTLIILGILGALAVDSWWDERAKREAEIDYLESLRADFIATRDSLNTEIEWEQRLIGDGKDIHANIASGLTQLSPAEFLQKISDFYWFSLWEWEPITATYNELVGSGRLEYIQSRTLRIMMGEYVRRVERLIDYRGRQISEWQLSHRPFVYKHVIVSDLGWAGDYQPVSPFENSYSELESKEFWNLISDWMGWHNTILTNYQRILEDGEAILELINSELVSKGEQSE